MKYSLPLLAAAMSLAACTDSLSPRWTPGVAGPLRDIATPTAQDVFQRYVALGTSNSMGVQSAGIFAAGQRAAWPAQLAARVGAPWRGEAGSFPGGLG